MAAAIGTFNFKVKSYDNEEGEYSPWQQAEPGTIIQFILNHWFNETLPNNLDIIVIKNEKDEQLVIDHENKDVFRFFLIPWEKGLFYYYKMTDIRFMFFVLEHFFSGLMVTLRENLNKTMDDWRWVKGDFLGKNFHFEITKTKIIRHFIGGLVLLIGSLLFLILSVLGIMDFTQFILLTVFILGYAIWSLPNNIKWYRDQKNLAITLSRGDRFIPVWYRNHTRKIPKAEIVSIKQHMTKDRDGDYWIPVFTQIDFQNGDTLNITDLLMPQKDISSKFFQERHIFHELRSNSRKLKKRTSLSGYFPVPQIIRKQYLK